MIVFQSTRPARGATRVRKAECPDCLVFPIHAPRAGRDAGWVDYTGRIL